MFKGVDPKVSFPEVEELILKRWDEEEVFKKSVNSRKGSDKFVFFDGPPFANGLPHYGHILANVLKDAVTRYWTMRGFYVPRTNGWDCHGLPVEYEIEKELDLSGRKAIVDYGVENFNKQCADSVFKYTKDWESTLKRIARWVDFNDSYATLDNTYMESIWWVFKQIWDKGLVYTGHKAMHVCPRCETPLSNFEVTQGYKDVTDLSVIAKFKLAQDSLDALGVSGDIFVLAWTTTPWTLPGNVALAFGPSVDYVLVSNSDGQFIVARDLADKVFGEGNYVVIDKINQGLLVGAHYEPLFDYYKNSEVEGQKYVIALADFVTTEDGTGVVHVAPMFGEDDYELGKKLGTAQISHVHMDGTFKDEVTDFAGKFVKGQDQNVADFLDGIGLLFSRENYRHSYPHCWRCDTPLLNFATRSLFIEVTKIKNRLIENNKKINWQPEHIKEGRFGKWLEGARDWAISRNRFWGCAIPVWECSCGEVLCIGSLDELKAKSDGKLPMCNGELNLHKPYIDDIKLKCVKCKKEMTRLPDVFDCWFESGSMPYAQLHYPFENKEEFDKNFPANFIAEGLDQTRGWFYTLHVISTILFDEPAFKNVIVNGILLAVDGEKLSKRKKNYPDPNLLFATKGVDSVRMFLYNSVAPLADDVRFSEAHVDEVVKKLTLTLWNTYSFFVTYANIDEFSPSVDIFNFVPTNKLDMWILSELNTLIRTVTVEMEAYNLTKASRPIVDFVENLSNWYVRRSRRRFWKSESDDDKQSAYQTLYVVLVQLSKVLAPFMPFIADHIYENLANDGSVHLCDWPKANEALINEPLNKEIHLIRLIVNLGHSVRAGKKIKVRQPLATLSIALPKDVSRDVVMSQQDVILEELNVRNISFIDEVSDIVDQSVIPNSKMLGPKFGKDVQYIIKDIKDGNYTLGDDGRVTVGPFVLEPDEVEVGFRGKDGMDVAGDEGVVVALDTIITDELRMEGYARDIVRYIQDMRKEADYLVDDRIYLLLNSEGEILESVVKFSDYIKNETLAVEISVDGDMEWDIEKVLDLDGVSIKIALRKS